MSYLPPILCSLIGTALLHLSWRRVLPGRPLTTATGWLFIAGSLVLWVSAAGAEYGSVFALLALPFAAWLFVAGSRDFRIRPATFPPRRGLHAPGLGRLFEHAGLFFATVPLAGGVSVLCSAALVRWLPGPEVNRLAFVVLFMPLLWGLLAVWVAATGRHLRNVSLMSGLGVLGGLLAAVN